MQRPVANLPERGAVKVQEHQGVQVVGNVEPLQRHRQGRDDRDRHMRGCPSGLRVLGRAQDEAAFGPERVPQDRSSPLAGGEHPAFGVAGQVRDQLREDRAHGDA